MEIVTTKKNGSSSFANELESLLDTAIEKHTARLIAELKPALANRKYDGDELFDVHGLSKYLSVETSWIYKQVSLKTIPYFKVGKYTRFRKRDIDRWIESQMVKPVLR